MKRKIKGYIMGIVATASLLIAGVAVIASPNISTRNIEAQFGNFKVYVNSVELVARDTDGNTIEHFAYRG